MKRGAIKKGGPKGGAPTAVTADVQLPVMEAPVEAAPRARSKVHPVKRALSAVASLRLTVVLMALSLFLVFAGTLAQIDAGIWSVVGQYFRSWYVWVPVQLFVKFGQIFFNLPNGWSIPGSFPFPAGYTLGFALLINLLSAHAVRFKLSWKRAGVITIHAGLVLMLVGEFITGQFAVEGNMSIETQLSSNYLESKQKVEIAVVNTTDPLENFEVVIPASIARKGGVISHPDLPFDVVIDRYFANCRLGNEGGKLEAFEEPVNSGANASAGEDMPTAYITLRKKGGNETVKQFLVSLWFTDWTARRLADAKGIINSQNKPDHKLTYEGQTYDVSLRWQRMYKPYTITLEEFKHEFYPGTDTPRNYSSKIHVDRHVDTDGKNQEVAERDTTIVMNSPMRYRGETFYQSGWLPGDRGTVLQVVRNPGWLMPYFSCALVTLGMIVHFGTYLINYLSRRAAA
jgi:hypothetical protein